MVLWSPAPAQEWLEAFPLGNGRMGAMVYGTPGREHLQVNDGSAWSGSPASEGADSRIEPQRAATALAAARAALDAGDPGEADRRLREMQGGWSQAYLPFADLHVAVTTGGERVTDYRRELDLATATHRVSYRLGGVSLRWTTFVSHADGVLVLGLDASAAVDVTWSLSSPLRVIGRTGDGLTVRLPSDMPPPHEPDLEPAWEEVALRGAVVIRTTHDGRSRTGGADGVRRLELVLATATTFDGIGRAPVGDESTAFYEASERADRAATVGLAALAERHGKAFAEKFSRTTLTLGGGDGGGGEDASERPTADRIGDDPSLAALLFDYGRYLAISSSAPGGLPSTLQGLWNDDPRPPWSSNYTINVNTQMNYWAAETADLGETLDPLIDLLEALADKGGATARTLYGARGWVAHHNTDAWAFTAPVGRGHADPSWSFWPMGGVWLCWLLRERLRFGGTDLGRIRPILRGAAEFCLDWLQVGPDGVAGTSPSTSPENHYLAAVEALAEGRSPAAVQALAVGQVRAGQEAANGQPVAAGRSSTMDLTLIAGLFDAYTEIAPPDDPVAAEIRAVRPAIPAPIPAADGLVPEWRGNPPQAEPGHRHLSHLTFAYPGDTPDDPTLRSAVSRSLDDRGDESTGWSLAWKLALRARLRETEAVSRLLDLVLRPAPADKEGQRGGLYPNLFAAHPPFQIDGNLGYVAAVAEMLVQSHSGMIDLLPAVPGQWPAGRVTGLVARPGVAVDVGWETVDGQVRAVEIAVRARRPAGRTTVTVRLDDRRAEVDLSDGRRVLLDPTSLEIIR